MHFCSLHHPSRLYPLDRGIHVFIGQQGKITSKIPMKFLFSVGSCEWESPKESLYHEFGAVLFICCKKRKTNVLILLVGAKIRAVSSSLCWFRLNQTGPCNNCQLVCLQKVRMPGLKERKVKEEKVRERPNETQMQNSKQRRKQAKILPSEGKFAVNANHPPLFGLACLIISQ